MKSAKLIGAFVMFVMLMGGAARVHAGDACKNVKFQFKNQRNVRIRVYKIEYLNKANNRTQFLDSRKEEMRRKLANLKEARGFQLSEVTKKTMTDTVTQNVTRVASLQIKYVGKSVKDPNYKSKLEKLVKDYSALLTS